MSDLVEEGRTPSAYGTSPKCDSLSLPVLMSSPQVGFGGGRAALGAKSKFVNDSTFTFPQIPILNLGEGREGGQFVRLVIDL
jgi:hypothetical protein